jgi:redox-sensitive bicupin YhaK (pirin superfamily)
MTDLLRLGGRVSELADGLTVWRALPAAGRRSVGPFVFFDHFGPVTFKPETDSDVGAHPHIGLATVSYLFEGSLLHRDSLGTVQTITPGAINWMTAGRGIVHSERTLDEERGESRRLHGLQLWVALPLELQACEPSFQHVPAAELPALELDRGVQVRVLVGEAFGALSPVRAASPTLYLDVQIAPGSQWVLPALASEMALYSPQLSFVLDGQTIESQEMAVLPRGSGAVLHAGAQGARLVVIGGAPLAQPVRMWWNFVATDRERIAHAAKRWEHGDFESIPGETDRVQGPKWVG